MADPDIRASDMRATADEIEASNLPDYAKHYAIFAVLEQTKKRRGKPTRSRSQGERPARRCIREIQRQTENNSRSGLTGFSGPESPDRKPQFPVRKVRTTAPVRRVRTTIYISGWDGDRL